VIVDSPVVDLLYNRLQFLAFEQAPARWVCEAYEASGGSTSKARKRRYNITIFGDMPVYSCACPTPLISWSVFFTAGAGLF